MTLEVVEPGLLTTIQDAGRPDWTHLGVPVGGAADPWSLAVANLLAGADAGAAALEMTIVGPSSRSRERRSIGLAGADLGGVVRETGRRLLPGRSHPLDAGSTIAFPGGDAGAGARAYLALPGGIDVPGELGSASTLVSAGFGGIDGPGAAGRRRPAGGGRGVGGAGRAAHGPGSTATRSRPRRPAAAHAVRIVAGPAPGADVLASGVWRCDRTATASGSGWNPQPGNAPLPGSGELLTHGVVRGAIQLPPGGAPMILLADHQTTGGYPVAAVVARADHPRLGQLRPGDAVRFSDRHAGRGAGGVAASRTRPSPAALRPRCAASDAWDDLWQSAGR